MERDTHAIHFCRGTDPPNSCRCLADLQELLEVIGAAFMPAVNVSKVMLLRQHELQSCKHHCKIIAIQLIGGE